MIKLDSIEPVDLSSAPDPPNRIKLLGIELEGGWKVVPDGSRITRDSSVVFGGNGALQAEHRALQRDRNLRHAFALRYNRNIHTDGGNLLMAEINQEWEAANPAPVVVGPNPQHVGEIPSPPLEVDKWLKWMRTNYPPFINATCGMHVHQSYDTSLTYQRLMTPQYPKTVLEEFKKWAKEKGITDKDHPLNQRLYGTGQAGTPSEFCQPLFQADEQARRTEKRFNHFEPGHRYTVMNYCWGMGNRQTIECRLLPMFEEIEIAIDAINKLLAITNSFLFVMRKKESRRKVAVISTGEEMNRRIEVRI